MKVLKYIIVCLLVLIPIQVHAIDISITSSISISNAPANSKWQVECGGSTGVYNLFTRQFTMDVGVNVVPVSSIFLSGGNYFCRTMFVQAYGQSSYSPEVTIVVTVPVISAPSLAVIP